MSIITYLTRTLFLFFTNLLIQFCAFSRIPKSLDFHFLHDPYFYFYFYFFVLVISGLVRMISAACLFNSPSITFPLAFTGKDSIRTIWAGSL